MSRQSGKDKRKEREREGEKPLNIIVYKVHSPPPHRDRVRVELASAPRPTSPLVDVHRPLQHLRELEQPPPAIHVVTQAVPQRLGAVYDQHAGVVRVPPAVFREEAAEEGAPC